MLEQHFYRFVKLPQKARHFFPFCPIVFRILFALCLHLMHIPEAREVGKKKLEKEEKEAVLLKDICRGSF